MVQRQRVQPGDGEASRRWGNDDSSDLGTSGTEAGSRRRGQSVAWDGRRDFLARDRLLEVPHEGDLLAVRTVGAYGFAMASNYNGRLRPAEALVDGSELRLARRRESFEDLIRGEE